MSNFAKLVDFPSVEHDRSSVSDGGWEAVKVDMTGDRL